MTKYLPVLHQVSIVIIRNTTALTQCPVFRLTIGTLVFRKTQKASSGRVFTEKAFTIMIQKVEHMATLVIIRWMKRALAATSSMPFLKTTTKISGLQQKTACANGI